MAALDAVAALAAVAVPVVLVLRDVTAADRQDAVPRAEPAPVRVEVPAPRPYVPAPIEVQADEHGSMLASLTMTEQDEHSPLRRVGALVLLLTLTLLTAGLVGAGIYRAVSGLG